jgi:hypothetical protein
MCNHEGHDRRLARGRREPRKIVSAREPRVCSPDACRLGGHMAANLNNNRRHFPGRTRRHVLACSTRSRDILTRRHPYNSIKEPSAFCISPSLLSRHPPLHLTQRTPFSKIHNLKWFVVVQRTYICQLTYCSLAKENRQCIYACHAAPDVF